VSVKRKRAVRRPSASKKRRGIFLREVAREKGKHRPDGVTKEKKNNPKKKKKKERTEVISCREVL